MTPRQRYIQTLAINLAVGTVVYVSLVKYVLRADLLTTGSAITLVILVAVSIGGAHVELRWRRHAMAGFPRCGKCGYSLEGHQTRLNDASTRCPECGQQLILGGVAEAGELHREIYAAKQRRVLWVAVPFGYLMLIFCGAVAELTGRSPSRYLPALAFMALLYTLLVGYALRKYRRRQDI